MKRVHRTVTRQASAPDAAAILEPLLAEPVLRWTLPNGLVALHKEDHAAKLVSAQVWVRTGSIHEDHWVGTGLSHYLEHMVFKGTAKRGPLQISAEVQAAGGTINAYTTFDRTVYYIDGPAESAPLFLDVLADMVFQPKLDAAEVAREREVILREIDMTRDDPQQRVMEGLFALAFRQHPYRYPVIGLRPLFEGLSRDDLASYHAGRYAPNNAVVVLCGALRPEEAQALVEKQFGALTPRRLPAPVVAAEPPQLAARAQTERGDVNVVRGVSAYRVPSLSHPDAPALDLLGLALGGGQASLLWQKLREELTLVHHIHAGNWNPGEAGLTWISYSCDEGKRAAVEAAVAAEIARVAQSRVPADMLARGRRQVLVGEVDSRRTVSGQASRLGLAEVVLGDLDYPRVYFQRLAKVKAADLTEVAVRYLRPDQCSVIALEPETKTKSAKTKGGPKISGGWPDFEEIKFKNGARLLLQPGGSLPKVHVRAALQGGPCYEDDEHRGVTSLMATLLTRDAGGRSARQVAQDIEGAGAIWSEQTGNNSFSLAFESLEGDLALGARVLRAALWQPEFAARTFAIERDSQLSELREEADEIDEYGLRVLRRKFFGRHPLGIAALGTETAVARLTVENLRRSHRRLVVGPNLVLAAAGKFERARVVDLFGPVLEAAPAVEFASLQPVHQAPKAAEFSEKLDREQTVVFDAYPDAGVTSGDYLTGEMVDELLSGMSSRLFVRVREELGLAYYVGAARVTGLRAGMFYFYSGTQQQTHAAVLAEFDAEVARLRGGAVEADELARARARLKAQLRIGRQSPGNRALQAALNALYGLPLNDAPLREAAYNAADPAAVRAFAEKYLRPETRVRLVVKPKKS